MARRVPAEQLDLFTPPPEDEQPLVFRVACHFCDPPRIITVVPVESEIVPGWPVPSPWGVAEKFAHLAYVEHLNERHPERVPPRLHDR